MSSTYIPINQYNGSYVIPSDGDPAVAESVNTSLRALGNTEKFNSTQIGHQMADDRGKTSTLTGPIVVNDGGGSIDFEVALRLGGEVDVYADFTIHTGHALRNVGTTSLEGDTTIGTADTDTLNVEATANFNNTLWARGDFRVASGHVVSIRSDTTVTADLTADGTVQLGVDPATQAVGIGAPLTVSADATFEAALSVNGDATLGNASTDNHRIRGDLVITGDTEIHATLDVQGDTTLEGNLELQGELTAVDDVLFKRNVTLGDTSNDRVTFNALIDSPVGFADAGRVPYRLAQYSLSSRSYGVNDGNYLPVLVLPTPANYSLTDGTVDGDFWMISNLGSATLTVYYSGSSWPLSGGGNHWVELVWFSSAGSWFPARWG